MRESGVLEVGDADPNTTIIVHLRPFLIDFTSNPATPTKTSHRKGSWKALF
jgi:hypothetical protein